MALQGTLDTFALNDVLRLLATTHKTGRLRVTADRGSGSVWFDGGSLVAASTSTTTVSDPLATVIFELLRHREGSFIFEPDVTTPDAGAPVDIDSILRDAERLVIEWREIEAVVPSLDAYVTLSQSLPRAEVVVDAARWKLVVGVGAGATVRQLGASLGLSEIEVSKAAKDAVETGLLRVEAAVPPAPKFTPTPPPSAQAVPPAPTAQSPAPPQPPAPPPAAPQPPAERPAARQAPAQPAPAIQPPAAPAPVESVVDVSVGATAPAPSPEPAAKAPESAGPEPSMGITIPGVPSLSATWDAEPQSQASQDDDEDLLRALGNLTPQAARAIAAAAQANNDSERDAALDQAIAANHEPLDRTLLLRFLSSVKQ